MFGFYNPYIPNVCRRFKEFAELDTRLRQFYGTLIIHSPSLSLSLSLYLYLFLLQLICSSLLYRPRERCGTWTAHSWQGEAET